MIFIYNNKIYRYFIGSPTNIPLVRQIRLLDNFMKWPGTTDPLLTCLHELNEQHPDVQGCEKCFARGV